MALVVAVRAEQAASDALRRCDLLEHGLDSRNAERRLAERALTVVKRPLTIVVPPGTLLDPAAPLRDQIDIDSMDFLNFVTAVHKQLGVPIPELDYPRLASLDGAVHYVLAKLAK